uniref:Uncharacterized protein n=1 Tax=Arundo donax TaxID=35708 RepID=A0A0A9H458_ARUDO
MHLNTLNCCRQQLLRHRRYSSQEVVVAFCFYIKLRH